ncbi:hypothetical protein STENM327S_08138 [Streptomyces tendae]
MRDVYTASRDRLAVAVLAQYRMATTEQMHLILSPDVRIEQTRRRLVKLRGEGLIDRVTLPQAGRTRVWYTTRYGAQVASEWPELRGRRPPRGAHDRTAVRLGVGHGLTVTETGLAFLQDARRRGDLCQALDWIPEVHHSLGGEAVIPDALLYYRSHGTGAGGADSSDGEAVGCVRSTVSSADSWVLPRSASRAGSSRSSARASASRLSSGSTSSSPRSAGPRSNRASRSFASRAPSSYDEGALGIHPVVPRQERQV